MLFRSNPPAGFVALAPAAGSPDDEGAPDRASANEADDTDPSDRTVATSTDPTNGGTGAGGGGSSGGGSSSTGGTGGGVSSGGGGSGSGSTGGGDTAGPLVFADASLRGANPFGAVQGQDYAIAGNERISSQDQGEFALTLAQTQDDHSRRGRYPGLTAARVFAGGERQATTELTGERRPAEPSATRPLVYSEVINVIGGSAPGGFVLAPLGTNADVPRFLSETQFEDEFGVGSASYGAFFYDAGDLTRSGQISVKPPDTFQLFGEFFNEDTLEFEQDLRINFRNRNGGDIIAQLEYGFETGSIFSDGIDLSTDLPRNNDHFLIIETATESQSDPGRLGASFLFANGGVDDDALDTSRREDVFLITPGLFELATATPGDIPAIGNYVPPSEFTPFDETRAFLRPATAGIGASPDRSVRLVDTGLRVLGTPALSVAPDGTYGASNDVRTVAVHADFGFAARSDDAADRAELPLKTERSTISLTLGEVSYSISEGYQPTEELRRQFLEDFRQFLNFRKFVPKDVVLTARTIGTSQGFESSAGSVAMTSDLFTTAFGGGNPNFQESGGETINGRAGFFVLDNYDPVAEPALGINDAGAAVARARYAEGGEERPSNEPPGAGQRFALQRLAFGVDSIVRAPTDDDVRLAGFAAGLGEAPAGDQVRVEPLRTAEYDVGESRMPGFLVEREPSSHRLTVTANLVPLRRPADATTVTLGGTDPDVFGASAYLDADRFAARSPRNVGMPDNPRADGDDLAMVSADLLAEGAATANAETQALLAAMSGEPDYKWGFFFGDAEVGSARVHTHLGTWVAGRFTDPDVLDAWADEPGKIPGGGTATYSGPAIGNVADRGAMYTATGTYTNAWDFAAREGATELAFDGATMRGTTANPAGTAAVRGRLGGEGTARRAEIRGAFVGGDANALPSAQIGSFAVSDGEGYTAAGTFAGKR